MPTKKYQQKLLKYRVGSIARVVTCASFLVLAIIGISSLVRAMSLEDIANENGIPASWEVASLGNPETITVPITYWDQRQDDCKGKDRQFEWTQCQIYGSRADQGLVKSTLGADGLPVPAHTTSAESKAAGHDEVNRGVLGNDPVQSSDNFYQWFHDTARSQSVEREVTFRRVGNNTYKYGGSGIFPLDNVNFSKDDAATKTGHNFHFTAHLQIPMKIDADGREKFEFSGDDDVWVFLDGKLVLDIGGVHQKLGGWFIINQDGTIRTYVETVGEKTIDIGLQPGKVVNLDFFYAERSTSESNTEITIANMNWPISTDSTLEAEIIGKIESTDSNLVQFTASVHNCDPDNSLELTRIAAYIEDDSKGVNASGDEVASNSTGFLPLDMKTLSTTRTPSNLESWTPVEITAPENSDAGFQLVEPIELAPDGQTGDEAYFRFFAETSEYTGAMSAKVSFYTELDGAAGVTFGDADVKYAVTPEIVQHQLSIEYVYEDGTEAAPVYTDMLYRGKEFSIDSPAIEGFTPDYENISGTMDDAETTYVVTYRSNTAPEPEDPEPDQPVEPEPQPEEPEPEPEPQPEEPEPEPTPEPQPEEPEPTPEPQPEEPTPTPEPKPERPSSTRPSQTPEDNTTPEPAPLPSIPIISDSNILDDSLIYVEPLGEVAYIPNTGVISSKASPVFEQYFAEVVLSHGFILSTLLVFAGSFSLYFSFRRYLNPTKAARVASSRNRVSRYTASRQTRSRSITSSVDRAARKATKATNKIGTKAAKTTKKLESKATKAAHKAAVKADKTVKKAKTGASKAAKKVATKANKVSKKLSR